MLDLECYVLHMGFATSITLLITVIFRITQCSAQILPLKDCHEQGVNLILLGVSESQLLGIITLQEHTCFCSDIKNQCTSRTGLPEDVARCGTLTKFGKEQPN